MQRLDLMFCRKYEKDGQEKTAYQKCGIVLVKPDGKISINLSALPVGCPAGDLWLSAMEPRQNGAPR
jgi:hypothetical protein